MAGRDLLHAGVIERALAQATVIAGRTRQIHAHDRLRPLVRPDVNRIRRTKYAHHRFTQRRGHMHRPRVVCHRHFGALNQRRQICWSSFTAKIDRSRRGGCDLPAARLIAFRTRESNSKSFAKKLRARRLQILRWSSALFPKSSRAQEQQAVCHAGTPCSSSNRSTLWIVSGERWIARSGGSSSKPSNDPTHR